MNLELKREVYFFDDLVAKETQDYIENYCIEKLKWSVSETLKGTSSYDNSFLRKRMTNHNIFEYMQFVSIFNERDFYNHVPVVIPMYAALSKMSALVEPSDILKLKVNLQPKNTESENKYNFPHIDLGAEQLNGAVTIIYYVNESEGPTYFFEGRADSLDNINNLKIIKKVDPKKGRLVVFRSDILHAGSHPHKSDYRMVINYNLKPKPFLDHTLSHQRNFDKVYSKK